MTKEDLQDKPAVVKQKRAQFECTVNGVTIGYEYEPAQNGGFDEPSHEASIDVVCIDVDL